MIEAMKHLLFLSLLSIIAGCSTEPKEREARRPIRDTDAPLKFCVPNQMGLKLVSEPKRHECLEIQVDLWDDRGRACGAVDPVDVRFEGEGKFFSTPSCANPFGLGEIQELPIRDGKHQRSVYFKTDNPQPEITIHAKSDFLGQVLIVIGLDESG